MSIFGPIKCLHSLDVTSMLTLCTVAGPWQPNFVDAHFLQFHMFLTIWSRTTSIGLPAHYISVTWKFRKSNRTMLLRTVRLSMCPDMPLSASNARGAKYAAYYVGICSAECSKMTWLHSTLPQGKKMAHSIALLVYSLAVVVAYIFVCE